MSTTQSSETPARKPLRLWPGVAFATLGLAGRFVAPLFGPEAAAGGVFGGMVATLGILLWWLFFSRARWSERLGAVGLMAFAVFVTRLLVDQSIAGGAMGFLLYVLAVPLVAFALVAWAAATRQLTGRARWLTMAAAIALACVPWTLIRTGGFDSKFDNDFAWRWSQSAEERLVASANDEPAPPPAPAAAATPPPPAEAAQPPVVATPAPAAVPSPTAPPPAAPEPDAVWPGFRGPARDGLVRGVRIKTDWAASPPVEMWRRPIGPGWSSFAVQGDRVYTQEQRGEDEVVACYRASTGQPVWRHRDRARFWESNAGAGPRATPTLSGGRVYTLGGTGIVNALDARTGAVVWSRNAVTDTGAKVPIWGISGSPLVLDDLVLVAAASTLVAYDRATGAPRWTGPAVVGDSYSSPQLATIGGVEQVLLLNREGLTSVGRADGKPLWQHAWKGYPIVQPGLTADGDILISVDQSSGLRRLSVSQGGGGWTAQERWTSTGLKPYFSDFVVHKGHAYGFDGSLLSCIDLQDGQRKWKGGRYGQGQLVLLPDQDLLLVLAEEGDLALVSAAADGFKELARIPAIKGKTWNHPVLAGDVLLARNGEEMAAFRVALDGR